MVMWRRELLRKFTTALRPEEHLEEKMRSQTYTSTYVSKETIKELKDICTTHEGRFTTSIPRTPVKLEPVISHRRVKKEIRERLAIAVGLTKPPPEHIEKTEDFLKLPEDKKLTVCKEIFKPIEEAEDLVVLDDIAKQFFNSFLELEQSRIAREKGKTEEELTPEELEEARRTALQRAYLATCGHRISKYFEKLLDPTTLAIYLEPEPEKKPVEKIICEQREPKWENMTSLITQMCKTARKHMTEKKEPFILEVEAVYEKKTKPEYKPFIQVVDEVYPNVLEPQRIPSHRVTIRMILDTRIRVPKDKLRKAIDYLKTYRPSTLATIKTDKDLEREIILTLFKRIENRVNDLLRHTCTPDIREEYKSLHPKQIKLFKEIYRLVESKYSMLPRGMKEEDKWKEAYKQAKEELVKLTEELIVTREEEVRKMFAEMLATKTLEIAGRTIFETLPTEPTCPPRVTIDILRRKEKEVTLPSLLTAGYRIVEELKTLEVEIEVEELELRIEFCTPWCSAIECVLKNITPDYIMDEIVREAKRLGFVEVIIPYPSPSPQ
jgi:hypothetical protein